MTDNIGTAPVSADLTRTGVIIHHPVNDDSILTQIVQYLHRQAGARMLHVSMLAEPEEIAYTVHCAYRDMISLYAEISAQEFSDIAEYRTAEKISVIDLPNLYLIITDVTEDAAARATKTHALKQLAQITRIGRVAGVFAILDSPTSPDPDGRPYGQKVSTILGFKRIRKNLQRVYDLEGTPNQ